MTSGRPLTAVATAAVSVAAAVFAVGCHGAPVSDAQIDGPYADLLASSTDLGPARDEHVQLTAALHETRRPERLFAWSGDHGLSVRWRDGDAWAVLEGPAAAMSAALGIDVHDYRGQRGQLFYAAPQQPAVPDAVQADVAELGRVLSYTPHRESRPPMVPAEVPDQGLSPSDVVRTYNIAPLHEAGHTGRGSTVVVFAFDGFDQADLDSYSSMFNLAPFTPEVIGGQPSAPRGEATMDLEVIHAIAPDAKTVLVNARPTVEGAGAYQKIAQMMEDADQRYPGAVWSFSIGWGCDKLITAADLVPVRAAGQGPGERDHHVRRQRRPRRPGMQRRRRMVLASACRQRRSGRGGVDAGDDQRRWHHLVDRQFRRLVGRAGLVRRSLVTRHRRGGVVALRPSGLAGADGLQSRCQATADA